jgi:hypothetical protein
MTRTAPDPVLAAAVQEELERRVRAHRRGSASPDRARRRWMTELAAIAGLVVLATGIAVGVTSSHPWSDGGGAPIGAVTPSVVPVAPTDGPQPSSPEPSPTSSAPTSRPASGTLPTSVPVPTGSPTSPAAATGGPSTPVSALIAPAGAVRRSDAEIRADAAARGFTDVWAEQGILDRDCMADHGFLYDPELGLAAPSGLSSSDRAAYEVALLGPASDAPYDWRTAGCHGASVHATGQDGAH